MEQHVIGVQDLHYTYSDGTHALKGVSINVKRGQTTAILGGNGAGKSTLFLTFNGIIKPGAGRVLFNGKPLEYSRSGLRKLRSSVGMVFQDPDSQLFSASVCQDVSFGLVNMKLPEEEVRGRVTAALARTGAAHLSDKPTHSLSFGQKKRVAIAGVLAMEPELLVLDEPTAGLDPRGVSDIMRLLREMQKELGLSIVISTHDIDLVPLYCDRAYVMDQGHIVAQGTPKEVFAHPEALRSVHLRLPRVAHLMEILQANDGFKFEATASTIAEARNQLNTWRHNWEETRKEDGTLC